MGQIYGELERAQLEHISGDGANVSGLIYGDNSSGSVVPKVYTGSRHSKLLIANKTFTTKAADYNAVKEDEVIFVDSTGTGRTVTLPDATTHEGVTIKVMKIDSGSIFSAVAASGGQTINGATVFNVYKQYDFVTVMSDGSNWIIVGFHSTQLEEALASADTATTLSATYVDATGMTIPLSRGIWEIGYSVLMQLAKAGANGAVYGKAVIREGSNDIVKTSSVFGASEITAGQAVRGNLKASTQVVVTTSVTYKLSFQCSQAAAAGVATLEATASIAGLTDPDGESVMWARRVG